MNAGNGLLVLMGSGETSPTMVTLHRELVAHLGGDADAVILETPYGFQVNRDDISNRARECFRRSVSLATVVAPDMSADAPSIGTPGAGDADKVRDLGAQGGLGVFGARQPLVRAEPLAHFASGRDPARAGWHAGTA
ncbi:hypothetical protein [Streptomyces parvus]|uniref:hypothetical protein n=1 Tax=Streptomyces parvus TaxID=66428 RepID=UPI0034039A29